MSGAVKNYHEAVDEFRKAFLTQMLAAHNGNRTHTAKAIGLQRTYLLRLLRQYGLTQFRPTTDKPSSSPSASKTNGLEKASAALQRSMTDRRPYPVEAFIPAAVNISFPQLRAV